MRIPNGPLFKPYEIIVVLVFALVVHRPWRACISGSIASAEAVSGRRFPPHRRI